MARIAAAVAAVAATALSVNPATARSVSVTVVNRPVQGQARVENGRILLPMRATFEALYSTVSYDPTSRVIIARNVLHELRLRIGVRDAVLDGHLRTLDVPVQVRDGRVYIPLRFAAEAMGAIIRYDPGNDVVSINGSDTTVKPHDDYVAHPPQEINPPPNSYVPTAYPVISASLGSQTAARSGVNLTIDGADVTPHSAFDGRTITYVPTAALAQGRHTVAFSARSITGQPFYTQWTFATSAPAMDTGTAAAAYGGGYGFYGGAPQLYGGGGWMNLTMIGPPNGSGFVQICNPNFIYPLSNGGGSWFRARIALPTPYLNGGCPITGIYVGPNGVLIGIPLTSNGLYLTGDPLHPIGQFPPAPIIVPILPLHPPFRRPW